uniref:Venom peptide n=1 Tax=Dasymutilla chiron TaxID=374949 RepID=A0A8T9VMB4_DASCH|nr:venom peptide precursor [Dasymutilla chiron]
MNLGILSYVFMMLVIMAFSNIADNSAEVHAPIRRICKINPMSPLCMG